MPWNKLKSLSAECPECDSNVTFVSKPSIAQNVICAACGTNLEVAYLDPIMLDWTDNNVPLAMVDSYEYDDFDDEIY